MIKIEAIVPPFKLLEICEELKALEITGFLVTEAKDCFALNGSVTAYRGVECFVDLIPCVKIELIVERDDAANTVHAIRSAVGSTHARATILTSELERVIDMEQAALTHMPFGHATIAAA